VSKEEILCVIKFNYNLSEVVNVKAEVDGEVPNVAARLITLVMRVGGV
jgi:predicted RNA methylase